MAQRESCTAELGGTRHEEQARPGADEAHGASEPETTRGAAI